MNDWQPPPGHPISTDKAKELLAGDLGDVYRNILSESCVPIYWFDMDQTDQGILHNGTLTVVQTNQRLLGITAEHVIAAYLTDRKDLNVRLQIGNAIVENVEIIDKSERVDIATVAIDPVLLSKLGKDVTPLSVWPPRPPDEGRGIMFAGYPGGERLEEGDFELSFGLYTAVGVARHVTDEQITWVGDRDFVIDHPNIPTPPPGYDSGGISGGPLISWFETETHVAHYCLSGIISQAHAELEYLVAKRADFIRGDGSIRIPKN